MDLHPDDPAFDPETQQRHDRRRLFRALNLSLAFVLLLAMVYSAQGSFDVRPFTIAPLSADVSQSCRTRPSGSGVHVMRFTCAAGALASTIRPSCRVPSSCSRLPELSTHVWCHRLVAAS